MVTNMIDAEMLTKMFLAGAKNLEVKKEWINELNVFPVPDGDTGTNMTMTIMSAASEVRALKQLTMENLAKSISSGSLRGARGNSGVILSQLLRGFTKGIREHDTLDTVVIAAAFQKAVETAYKAVMKPKEGTILTVAKAMAEKAAEIATESDDFTVFFEEIIKHGDYVLSQTPEMLPVLKEAGVVDSGGQGLMEACRGAVDAFLGKEVDLSFDTPAINVSAVPTATPKDTADIKFGYCTEFIILLDKEFNDRDECSMKEYLTSIGDSLVLVADDDIVKIHVHTNEPGNAIQKALTYGQLSRIKIDNMREEHQEKLFREAEKLAAAQSVKKPEKEVGFIAISIGDGIDEIFKELGVDVLIKGGQTMNPSTEDMLKAIEETNAKNVFIFPNNKNIILAANQAQALTKDRHVIVIPTKTVPQGITAMINYVPERNLEENVSTMQEEIKKVKTGQVTYAVRDTHIDGKEIQEGDIMGIGDDGLLSVGSDISSVTKEMIQELVDDDSELISIYYGEEFPEEEAEALAADIGELYSDCDVEVHSGGQPIYYCVVSVE